MQENYQHQFLTKTVLSPTVIASVELKELAYPRPLVTVFLLGMLNVHDR
jgi:hypothetical protein